MVPGDNPEQAALRVSTPGRHCEPNRETNLLSRRVCQQSTTALLPGGCATAMRAVPFSISTRSSTRLQK
jgi:hypothetical protein